MGKLHNNERTQQPVSVLSQNSTSTQYCVCWGQVSSETHLEPGLQPLLVSCTYASMAPQTRFWLARCRRSTRHEVRLSAWSAQLHP